MKYDSYYHFKPMHDNNEIKDRYEYESIIKRKQGTEDLDMIDELF
jgi:hypothetical protein